MAGKSMNSREKKLIVTAVACFIGIVVYFSGVKLSQNLQASERQLAAAETRLEEVRMLRATILSERTGHKAIQDLIKARGGQFDLYSYANQCILQHKLQDRATLQSSGGRSVQVDLNAIRIKFRNVNMKELSGFLHTLYDGNNIIALQQLTSLHPSANNQGLDCDISFVAPKG